MVLVPVVVQVYLTLPLPCPLSGAGNQV
jgi:hypothetical protein